MSTLLGVLGILGAAALFALFGWLMRGKRLTCGGEGSCPSLTGGCASCHATPAPRESDHAQR